MFDHLGVAVADAEESRKFYETALAPLGITLIMSVDPEYTPSGGRAHGFGKDGKPSFWFGDNNGTSRGVHIAFVAPTRAQVDSFYAAAINAGGRDNGPPGVRPHYHPDYYGAFVLDPDGINVEAVCHSPE